jgi:hypothetical protein
VDSGDALILSHYFFSIPFQSNLFIAQHFRKA